MSEKTPKRLVPRKEVAEIIGKSAARSKLVKMPQDIKLKSGIERQDDGTVDPVSEKRFNHQPGMTEISQGYFNPNHN